MNKRADLRPAQVVYSNPSEAFWPDLEGRIGLADSPNKYGNVGFYSTTDPNQINSSRYTVLKATCIKYLD